jgi:iron complex outermembrane receptor protein
MNRMLLHGIFLMAGTVHAAPPSAPSLADLSLEELSSIKVTTVSGRDEPLARAPASVYVISAEDIRRSGALSLPEALRLAPNLQVGRVDASQYAISARGFNDVLANRLLVLIDGRRVYTPLFSGTFWEAQDVLLEDVERIEVISGPGAALWGANAVNGVINVITRPASDTHHGLISLGAGKTQRDAAMRYGGTVGGGSYRVYGKAARRDDTRSAGASNNDEAEHVQVGFRADWGIPGDALTVQGDAYGGELAQGSPTARHIAGANLLGRWSRQLGDAGMLRLQGYFDTTARHHPGTFKENLDTYDIELQHGLPSLGRHRLLWGLGSRHQRDRVQNYPPLAFLPAERNLNRHQFFVQDEITIGRNLELTLGAKVDRNAYTGAEFLPSGRLGWHIDPAHFVWTALSRAVRAPSRIDREFFSPGTPPFAIAGGPDFRSEVSKVFELGYRSQGGRTLSFSATGYVHLHENLRTLSPQPGGAVVANDLEGRTRGIEAWGTYRGADWWRVSAGAVRQEHSLSLAPGAVNLAASPAARDPDGWWKLRAGFDIGAAGELDVMLRYYDELPQNAVPSYTALDLRLGWRLARDIEIALLLQNLADRRHVEWAPGAELERGAHVRLRLNL